MQTWYKKRTPRTGNNKPNESPHPLGRSAFTAGLQFANFGFLSDTKRFSELQHLPCAVCLNLCFENSWKFQMQTLRIFPQFPQLRQLAPLTRHLQRLLELLLGFGHGQELSSCRQIQALQMGPEKSQKISKMLKYNVFLIYDFSEVKKKQIFQTQEISSGEFLYVVRQCTQSVLWISL